MISSAISTKILWPVLTRIKDFPDQKMAVKNEINTEKQALDRPGTFVSQTRRYSAMQPTVTDDLDSDFSGENKMEKSATSYVGS